MTREECDELVADLQRICVLVEAVEPQRDAPDRWQIVAWCANPLRRYVISDAARFRQAVHDGPSGVVPKGALDRRGRKGGTQNAELGVLYAVQRRVEQSYVAATGEAANYLRAR